MDLTQPTIVEVMALIGVISGLVSLFDFFTGGERKGRIWSYGRYALIVLGILAVLYLSRGIYEVRYVALGGSIVGALWSWWYRKKHAGRVVRGEIKKSYDDQKFKRFEQVTTLVGGFIEYSPFLWTEMDAKKGIGVEVLKDALVKHKIEIDWHPSRGRWSNIFDELCFRQSYDIIATPLFETRSRVHDYPIIFCAPLFYSSIGIYVQASSYSGAPMKWSDALHFLRERIRKAKWKGDYIPGEISELLARKHKLAVRPEVSVESGKDAEDNDFRHILSRISDGHVDAQFVFMEVFKAESIMQGYHVKNILADNELLYPVSFALRKEDTVLRNLINLRLLEMRDNGDLENAFKRGVAPLNISDEKFKRMWVQKLPGSEVV